MYKNFYTENIFRYHFKLPLVLLSGCVNELYVITGARVIQPQESTRARRRYLGYGTRVHNKHV